MENNTNEFAHDFIQSNYDYYLQQCIDLIIDEKTNCIEEVTERVAKDEIEQYRKDGFVGDDIEEAVWGQIMECRGVLVKMYNIWFGLIKTEIQNYKEAKTE